MKIWMLFLAAIVLCVLAGCNNSEPPRIAVVDLVRTVNESIPGKKANAELDAMVKTKQAELKVKNDAVESLKKNLEKEPPATRKAREEELTKAGAEYQQLVALSDVEVKKRASELRNKVLADLNKILESIGNEDKFLVILTGENVVFHQKSIDITDKLIQKYNESSGGKQ